MTFQFDLPGNIASTFPLDAMKAESLEACALLGIMSTPASVRFFPQVGEDASLPLISSLLQVYPAVLISKNGKSGWHRDKGRFVKDATIVVDEIFLQLCINKSLGLF